MFKVRRRSGIFIINFEHVLHLFKLFLLLTLVVIYLIFNLINFQCDLG